MGTIDTTKWKPLVRNNSQVEEGISTSVGRLDYLFAKDLFMQMLAPDVRSRLSDVLAEKFAVWNPQVTKKVMRTTPYGMLWSDEFVSHVESLVWVASGKEKR